MKTLQAKAPIADADSIQGCLDALQVKCGSIASKDYGRSMAELKSLSIILNAFKLEPNKLQFALS